MLRQRNWYHVARMNKLCILIGTTVLGWVGWWLGEQLGGEMTAFVVSGIGSIAGVYLGWRIARDYL